MKNLVSYRRMQIDGLSIFYREAGPQDAPLLLLLHGLPSSSRMFEPLLQRLSDRYHLIAPDYPGFGHSDWPDHTTFAYTFDNLTAVMEHFTEAPVSRPFSNARSMQGALEIIIKSHAILYTSWQLCRYAIVLGKVCNTSLWNASTRSFCFSYLRLQAGLFTCRADGLINRAACKKLCLKAKKGEVRCNLM